MAHCTTVPCAPSPLLDAWDTASATIQAAVQYIMNWLYTVIFVSSAITAAKSVSIADIQGPAFQSPLVGQTVHDVGGLVTAKGPSGFWLAGEPVDDIRVSTGIYIFSTSTTVLAQVTVGDLISLGSAKVAEYRSSTAPDDLLLTELSSPSNITIVSSNNTVTPIVLGRDRSPPLQLYTPLDAGPDGILSVPNNVTQVESVNATLQPDKYGLDFWESLEGQLVSIPKPISLGFPNNYGEFWVHGDWKVTGKNGRGGLTVTFGPGGIPDLHPEAVIIGAPLDKTKNPAVGLGQNLSDITGVVTYQFGFYYVLPTTAPKVIATPPAPIKPTTLESSKWNPCLLTVGDYNVENLAPTSAHLNTIATHISTYLKTPDLMFVQEIQDNSGPKDDGTVSANVTLSTLTKAIASLSNVTYDYVVIDPVDGKDGGQPGGNIRQAYLYRPEKLKLVPGSPAGGSLDKVEVTIPPSRIPRLNFNPGRIEPTDEAWTDSRKPLVAHWQTALGSQFFTVNVHLASKGGSSSLEGNSRPPVNSPLDARTRQVSLVGDFVKSILDANKFAKVIVAGDFNEFLQTRSVYKPLTDVLTDIDEAASIPIPERYSYVFGQNSEQLDHIFISDALKWLPVQFEHIHINNWQPTLAQRTSDHDPSVARLFVC